MKKKIVAALSLILSTALLTSGCSLISGQSDETEAQKVLAAYDFSQMKLVQLDEPDEGRQMAVIKTSMGDISIMLYPEYCPNTVSNFVNRAKEGYYNNTSIFAIYTDSYFMAGSSKEDGTEGATDDGSPIANEYSVNLWPFKGALLAYNDTLGYGDSRFFVAGSVEITEDELTSLREKAVDEEGNQTIPEELLTAFVEKGSLPGLSCSYTVFAQTIDGFDVIDKILAISSDEDTLVPSEEVMINSVEITEYHA